MKGLPFSITDAKAHAEKHGYTLEVAGIAPESPVAAQKPARGAKQPNKTELAFRAFMAVKHLGTVELEFEAVKLRIGPNCYYTVDWSNFKNPRPVFYEVKGGHIWDDSLVKFKAAKERHKWAAFELWQKKAGEWRRLL